MSTTELAVPLSDIVVDLLREQASDHDAVARVREAVVLDLVRRGDLSRGRAAEELGLPLLDFLLLAGRNGIPFADLTPEEWADELETVRRLSDRRR